MRMEYNPRHIKNWLSPWKGFLTGSLILTSLSILAATENEMVFLGMVVFVFAGIALLLESLMKGGEEIPFLGIISMFAVGGVVSVVLALIGLAFLYFAVIIILIVLTYASRETREKIKKKVSRK